MPSKDVRCFQSSKNRKSFYSTTAPSHPRLRGEKDTRHRDLLKGYPVTYYKHVKFTINRIFCRLLTCRQLADCVIISLRTSDTSHRSGPWEPLDLDTPLKENAYHVGVVFLQGTSMPIASCAFFRKRNCQWTFLGENATHGGEKATHG